MNTEPRIPFDPQVKLIRLPQVLELCAMAKSSLYKAVKDGHFPAPVKLSERSSAWVLGEVEDWVRAKIAESRAV
jgi:prophage regulatory protein